MTLTKQECNHIPAITALVSDFREILAIMLSPGRHRSGYSVDGELDRIPSIVILLLVSGPSYISGLVHLVIVHPIQRMLRRGARPNVRQEDFKVIPFTTDGDTSSAIVLILPALRVVASLFHGLPSLVLRRLGLAVRGMLLFVIASTRCCAPAYQCGSGDRFDCAADTFTHKHSLLLMVGGALNDSQSSEDLAGNISEVRHRKVSCK